jgi:hypothetical protein
LRPSRLAVAAVATALLASARPAAADNTVGLGADWFTLPQDGSAMVTLATDTVLAGHLRGGGRIGFLLGTGDLGPTVPIDGRLRYLVNRLYVDGLLGPWILFENGGSVRLHGAIGFGIARRGFELGLEVGYADPSAMVGVRLAWRIPS